MLFDGLLGGFAFAPNANAKDHFRGDGKQQESTGNAECGERNLQRPEKPIADQSRTGEDDARDNTCAHCHEAARTARQPVGYGEKSRRQSDRVDHDEQGQERRDDVIKRHYSHSTECGESARAPLPFMWAFNGAKGQTSISFEVIFLPFWPSSRWQFPGPLVRPKYIR